VLKWPTQSSDLNLIENLWKKLGHCVGNRNHSNRADLLQHLHWAKISFDFLKKLIQSMSQRCKNVIAAKAMAKY